MRCRLIFLLLLLCSSHAVMSQTLADLERQLDSLLRKREKSEFIIGLGYGNNPAYGSKTTNLELPIVMKTFIAPTVGYYHKSGLYATASSYYLFDAIGKPWFEWDFTAGYDYSKNRRFLTGISYTRYIFADSSDVPATPINNELFAYFYYRDWWLQPGISVDFGWGSYTEKQSSLKETISGKDFNILGVLRHPFVFLDVLKHDDAILLTPSLGVIFGTANYYSNLKTFQYISRSPKMKNDKIKIKGDPNGNANGIGNGNGLDNGNGREVQAVDDIRTGFELRAVDFTLNASYMIGQFTISPSYTVFKPFQGEDKSLMGYFTARLAFTIK